MNSKLDSLGNHSDLKEFMEESMKQVNAELDSACHMRSGCPARLLSAMRYSLLSPGKRLRPSLVFLGAKCCGMAEPDLFRIPMPAACAVEMVHAYSLIHDDLPAMDDDDLRRGRLTCHKQYDEATAILAGDALLTLSFEMLAKLESREKIPEALKLLSEAAGMSGMVGGQVDDMNPPKQGEGPREQLLAELEKIQDRKTGALIRVSLALGALVAGGTEEKVQALYKYGTLLGLAFQVTDDLLDVCGTSEDMGKRVGKDAEHGKLTYPGLLGEHEARAYAAQLTEEAKKVLSVFGSDAILLEMMADNVLLRKK